MKQKAKQDEGIQHSKRYNLKNLDKMNAEQLEKLEMKMMNILTKINNQKDRLRENQVLCILCLERKKNIECNHQDVCDVCKKELRIKRCPKC